MSLVKNVPSTSEHTYTERLDVWFVSMVQKLETDHFLMKENIASDETKNFYEAVIFGDDKSGMAHVRELSTKFFVKNLVMEYFKEISSFNRIPNKLALGLSDSKILVWAEINDSDEDTEDALLLAEARVNQKYHDRGFYITSTITETTDLLPVPPHYQAVKISTKD